MTHLFFHFYEIQQSPYWAFPLLFSYLLGSIPWGLVISKTFLGIDPRDSGSGNIGMTNVMRTGGKWPGIATFVLDFSKGTLAVWAATAWFGAPEVMGLLCGLLVVFGHTRSVFLKFSGGKGVATNFGVWLALDWQVSLALILIWAGLFLWKKISSLSGISALMSMPAISYALNPHSDQLYLASFLSLYLILLHKANIVRLVSGRESKLKSKSGGTDADQ